MTFRTATRSHRLLCRRHLPRLTPVPTARRWRRATTRAGAPVSPTTARQELHAVDAHVHCSAAEEPNEVPPSHARPSRLRQPVLFVVGIFDSRILCPYSLSPSIRRSFIDQPLRCTSPTAADPIHQPASSNTRSAPSLLLLEAVSLISGADCMVCAAPRVISSLLAVKTYFSKPGT